MEIKCFVNGQLAENCYLIIDEKTREALVIDPGSQADDLIDWIKSNNCTLKYIVNTHGHSDHIGANTKIHDFFKAKLLIHQNDKNYLIDPNLNLSAYSSSPFVSVKEDLLLKDNDTISLGNINFKVLHTPGHTPGGICLLEKGVLFSGDTLFLESIGRTDLPGGSMDDIINSLKEKILPLDKETTVFPGHGPQTTIKHELLYNPYIA